MLSLYLLAVNKGEFGLPKNGFSFFIHWLCHFLRAVKVFGVIFWPFYLVKKSIKTLDAHKKWHSQCMKKLNPFLESPNPSLSTAKRYKDITNYKLQNYRGKTLTFTPKKAGCSNHYDLKCIWVPSESHLSPISVPFKSQSSSVPVPLSPTQVHCGFI